MAQTIVGTQNNGGGGNLGINGTAAQSLNMEGTAVYVAGQTVQQLNVWLNDFSDEGSQVNFGLYDVTGGAPGATKLLDVLVEVPAGWTVAGYYSIALNESLPTLTGGETLAIYRSSRTSASGTLTFSTKIASGAASLAAAGETGPDPWVESSTATSVTDAYFVLDDPGSATGSADHTAATATHDAAGVAGTLALSLDLVDSTGAAVADMTGITAVVYDAVGGTELHETATAATVGGTCVIEMPGGTADVGAEVFVTLHKAGASQQDDYNGCGRTTVTVS